MRNPVLRLRARIALLRSTDRWRFGKPRRRPDSATVQRVDAALASMPPQTREVFMMHRFEDLSYMRIAQRLDIGVDEVEHYMVQALIHLWRELNYAP